MSEAEKDEIKLSRKQQIFIDEYLKCFNATAAALLAGYSEKSAHQIGWENLSKSEIKEKIQGRLAEVHMSSEEALKLTSDIARGDIALLVDVNGKFDMQFAQQNGLTKLIKKYKQKTTTKLKLGGADSETQELEIELYDAQAALRDILKVHGKYIDRKDITSNGESLVSVNFYIPDNGRENPK
ncbi:MAG: terminase small subunit [Chloroflexi bacterium]|nr:terminase small subunit [Chloroflexota bacterium]